MPNGKIQPKHKNSLKTMGNWLKKMEQLFTELESPIPPNNDYVSTQKRKIVFVHLLNLR